MELVMKSDGVHTELGSWSTNICRILNIDFHLEFQVPAKGVFFFLFISLFFFFFHFLSIYANGSIPNVYSFGWYTEKSSVPLGVNPCGWPFATAITYWHAEMLHQQIFFLVYTPRFSSFFSHKILFYLFMELWDPLRFVGFVQSYYLVVFCVANGDLVGLPALSTETLTVQFLCTRLMWCWYIILQKLERLSHDFARSKLTFLKMKLHFCECCFSVSFVR